MQDLKTFVDSVAIIDGEPTEVHYSPHHVFAHRSRSPELIARLEILASLNWHNGRGDGNQCGRCYSPLPDDCWFSPSAQRLVCSPECWALAEHWHHDYTAQ